MGAIEEMSPQSQIMNEIEDIYEGKLQVYDSAKVYKWVSNNNNELASRPTSSSCFLYPNYGSSYEAGLVIQFILAPLNSNFEFLVI